MLIESTVAVRFPAGDNFCFSSALSHYRSLSTSEEVSGVHVTSRRLVHSDCFNTPWTRLQRLNGNFFTRRTSLIRNRTRASAEHLGSASDPVKQNGSPQYHPFEDVADSTTENSGDAHLTDAETTRTVIEQVIIGFDTTEMMKEMELSGTSEIAFGIDEIEDEDSDVEDDEDEEEEDDSYDDEWVNVLDDEDEKLGDWAKLDTMSSSHPMYFTKKLAEVASGDPVDWMEEPPAGLAIQAS